MNEFVKLSAAHFDQIINTLDSNDVKHFVIALMNIWHNMNSYNQFEATHGDVAKWMGYKSRKVPGRILNAMIDLGVLTKMNRSRSNYMGNPQIFNRQNSDNYKKLFAIYKKHQGLPIILSERVKDLRAKYKKFDDSRIEKLLDKSYEESFLKAFQSQGIKVNSMIDVAKMLKRADAQAIQLQQQTVMLSKQSRLIQDMLNRMDGKLSKEEKEEFHKDFDNVVSIFSKTT
jgi:hypothetical protein